MYDMYCVFPRRRRTKHQSSTHCKLENNNRHIHRYRSKTFKISVNITDIAIETKLKHGLSNQNQSAVIIVMASVSLKLSDKLTQSSSVSFDCYHITITNTLPPDWHPYRKLEMLVPWSKHDPMTAAEKTPARHRNDNLHNTSLWNVT